MISDVDLKDYIELGCEQPSSSQPQLDSILSERGGKYGVFEDHAKISQEFKLLAKKYLRDKVLAHDQKEALDMIFHKIARIINGDPNYSDSWIDIAGYAKLVSDRLQGIKQ